MAIKTANKEIKDNFIIEEDRTLRTQSGEL